jgi:branched-chain amino acid transport system ATP-binding protein
MSFLKVSEINVSYGDVHILRDLSIEVEEGEIVSIVGGNGSGKSTLLKALNGLLRSSSGQIHFRGLDISKLAPHQIAVLGIAQVMEGRRLFPHMSVRDNLMLGAYLVKDDREVRKNLDAVYRLFPILQKRSAQLARSFSGGEQQMLAIGRGLMLSPKLLMLDEPSWGLAPILVNTIFGALRQINTAGVTIMLVEQDVKKSLAIAGRGYVIEHGRVVMEGPSQELLADPHLRKAYLGI